MNTTDTPTESTKTTDAPTESRTGRTDRAPEDGAEDRLELLARIERLEAENEQLRAEYARARQTRHGRTALALGVVGSVAVLGGLLFPDSRDVLVAIGATGLFGGILTYYLAPDRFIAASVGERVYATAASNATAITSALGLRKEYHYLPGTDATPARVYVPQYPDSDPPASELDPSSSESDSDTSSSESEPRPVDAGPFLTGSDERGLLLEASGDGLYREFERSLSGAVSSNPESLGVQLADAIVDGLELADRAEPDVDAVDGRLSVAVTGSAFGPVDRFDHPIASFLAVGVAQGLDSPVTLEVSEGDRGEWVITCRWNGE